MACVVVQPDTAFQLSLSCYMAVAWACQLVNRLSLRCAWSSMFEPVFPPQVQYFVVDTCCLLGACVILKLPFCSVHAAGCRCSTFRRVMTPTLCANVWVVQTDSRQYRWMAETDAGVVCPVVPRGNRQHSLEPCLELVHQAFIVFSVIFGTVIALRTSSQSAA